MLTSDALDSVCQNLMECQVSRRFIINQQNSLTNRATSLIARLCGYSSPRSKLTDDAEKKERKKVWTRAEGILKLAWNHRLKVHKDSGAIEIIWAPKPQENSEDAMAYSAKEMDLETSREGLGPFLIRRHMIETEMDAVAKMGLAALGAFIEATHGFSWHTLGVLVGEAGNLSRYPGVFKDGHPRAGQQRPRYHGPGCLNARFGLHLLKGREEKALSTWMKIKKRDGGLSDEEWKAAGYPPSRLGQLMGVVGVPLLMGKSKNRYGAIFDARRAHTLVTNPEWYLDKNGKQKVNPKTGAPSSEHARVDAGRIVMKAFLEDLWREWLRVFDGINDIEIPQAKVVLSPMDVMPAEREAISVVSPSDPMPPAEIPQARKGLSSNRRLPAEQRANRRMNPRCGVPSAPIPQARNSVSPKPNLPAEQRAKDTVKASCALPSAPIEPKGSGDGHECCVTQTLTAVSTNHPR